MRLSKVLASFAIVAAVGASAARADVKYFWNRCTPGSLRSCASLQVFTTPAGTGTAVQIWVRNEQGSVAKPWLNDNTGGSAIKKIGLVAPTGILTNVGSLTVSAVGGATVSGSAASKWTLASPGGLGGQIELQAGLSSGTNGAIDGCSSPFHGQSTSFRTCSTGWVVFSFTTQGSWTASQAELSWIPSDMRANNGGAGFECDTDSPATGQRVACTAVAPEPVTMLLLGSGLAGVGGMGFFRRRKTEIENS